MKNDPNIHTLLKDVYDQSQFVNHPWWEQRAFIHVYETVSSVRDITKIVHSRVMNSYIVQFENYEISEEYMYRRGDFIIHIAGIDDVHLLKNVFNRVNDLSFLQ